MSSNSENKIYSMVCEYKEQQKIFGMEMERNVLEVVFTGSRRYANHPSGKKYTRDGSV